MTVRDALRLYAILEAIVISFPVAVIVAVALVARFQRKHFDKWMHLYGSPELRRRILDQKNQIKWRDRKIEQLQSDKQELLVVVRGAAMTNVHTQQVLSGAADLYSPQGRRNAN